MKRNFFNVPTALSGASCFSAGRNRVLPAVAAAVGLAGGLGATLPAAAQVPAPWGADFQVPMSQAAIFSVGGAAVEGDLEGDAFLREVIYPDGSGFTRFYTPADVTDLFVEAEHGEEVTLRGGSNIRDGLPGLRTLGGFAEGVSRPTISEADVAAFSTAARDVLATRNLNNYIDLAGSPDFALTIHFERPVRDDDPEGPDVRGEILYFERGLGGGNSWLTFQAVDAEGAALGPALAVSPEETMLTVPPFSVIDELQQIGGLTIDVSRLGVAEVQHLRVRRTTSSDDGYAMIVRERIDFHPDFKVMAVITDPQDLEAVTFAYD